jgi:hypothetical protein
MYYRSHIYLTEQITGSRNPYLLFGSLFPDFHQRQRLEQGFDRKVVELMQFLKDKHPDLFPIGLGMTLHEFPLGVDKYVHQSYKGGPGYAFQFVEELFEETKQVLGFDDDMTRLMTHFLVENAIEHKIVNEHPETNRHLRECIDSLDKARVIEVLSEFYGIDKEGLEDEWKWFEHQAFEYDYGSYEGEGQAWADMMERLFNKKADAKAIGALIEKTQGVIASTVDEFLEFCVAQCRKDFEYNFPSSVGKL